MLFGNFTSDTDIIIHNSLDLVLILWERGKEGGKSHRVGGEKIMKTCESNIFKEETVAARVDN